MVSHHFSSFLDSLLSPSIHPPLSLPIHPPAPIFLISLSNHFSTPRYISLFSIYLSSSLLNLFLLLPIFVLWESIQLQCTANPLTTIIYHFGMGRCGSLTYEKAGGELVEPGDGSRVAATARVEALAPLEALLSVRDLEG